MPSGESETAAALADMAWTAGVGRSHLSHRAGLVFGDVAELRRTLTDLAEGPARFRAGTASTIAFAFTGQGSQWSGMGEVLYQTEPVVQRVLDQCDRLIQDRRGVSLLDVMFGRKNAGGDLDDTAWTQPAMYALECALVALWDSVGIRPDIVLGHSVGELAAAWTAGVFDLEDGLRLAAVRGELMSALPAQGSDSGAMAAVFASHARVHARVEEAVNAESEGVGLSVAADNITHQVVSGPAKAVKTLAESFAKEGTRVEIIETRHGFHSALMEPMLEDLDAAATGIGPVPPGVTLISTVTGKPVGTTESLDGSYWRRQARERVAFGTAVESLADMGVDVVVEIGPHPVLLPMMKSSWEASGGSTEETAQSLASEVVGDSDSRPFFVSSLRGPASDARAPSPASDRAFARAVAGLYEAGATLSFEGLFAGELRRRLHLPSYPFRRLRYWIGESRRPRSGGHPCLACGMIRPGAKPPSRRRCSHRIRIGCPITGSSTGSRLRPRCRAFLQRPPSMTGRGLRPSLIFSCMHRCFSPNRPLARNLTRPARTVQVVLGRPETGAARRVEVFSKSSDSEVWTLHAEGKVSVALSIPEARST